MTQMQQWCPSNDGFDPSLIQDLGLQGVTIEGPNPHYRVTVSDDVGNERAAAIATIFNRDFQSRIHYDL